MKYQCGPFIYDLPKTSCVFCQNSDVFLELFQWNVFNFMS